MSFQEFIPEFLAFISGGALIQLLNIKEIRRIKMSEANAGEIQNLKEIIEIMRDQIDRQEQRIEKMEQDCIHCQTVNKITKQSKCEK